MKKRMVCLTLALIMSAMQVVSVSASREEELREEQAWTSQQLDATYARIDELWGQKQQLESEIAALDESLVNVMLSIEVLESDISDKEVEIIKTKQEIAKAQRARDKQYEAMKLRIQYLFEKGGNDAWFQMMINAENLSDLLTRAEYTQQLYAQDRESLETYENLVGEVQNLEAQYEQEMAELEGMKQEYEAESANLQYEIDVKRAASADYENEIAYAQQMATEYANLIAQQQAEIERLEAERIAAEEEARRQAEAAAAAAAAAAAEEEAAQEASGETSDAEEAYEDGTYGSGEDYSESEDYSYEDYSDTDSSEDTSSDYVSTSSGSGSAVVDFATQFVGNPYVWGGTSLTNGADCSGFVQSVYANFGVSLPRTSYEQQNAGTEVSYADAQPGDLICYGGHVAIYMGNGQIVHASNSTDGIKISDNAAYRTILSVRRLV